MVVWVVYVEYQFLCHRRLFSDEDGAAGTCPFREKIPLYIRTNFHRTIPNSLTFKPPISFTKKYGFFQKITVPWQTCISVKTDLYP
jgi:hypothetical protein